MTGELQRKLESELDNFKAGQKELQKLIASRQQLDSQLNENDIVKQELNLLPAEARVFKSVGPVLIKTELVEAKQNVAKRLDFISKETKRVDGLIQKMENKVDGHLAAVEYLQAQSQQAKLVAATK